MPDPVVFESQEQFDRMARGVRWVEDFRWSQTPGVREPVNLTSSSNPTDVRVRSVELDISLLGEEIESVDLPACATGLGTGLYKGRIVHRDVAALLEEDFWVDGPRCLILSLNKEPLHFGARCKGHVVGVTEGGWPVVTVVPDGSSSDPVTWVQDVSQFPSGVVPEWDLVISIDANLSESDAGTEALADYYAAFGDLSGDWSLKYVGGSVWRTSSAGGWSLQRNDTDDGWWLVGTGTEGRTVTFSVTDGVLSGSTGGELTFLEADLGEDGLEWKGPGVVTLEPVAPAEDGNTTEHTPWKPPARVATTAALPSNTYTNGFVGIGATLTGSANGALPAQDGVALALCDRILVKNEASQSKNGLYVVTELGDATHPYILTRSEDADTGVELLGAVVAVLEGTVNKDTTWLGTADAPVEVGTTLLPWKKVGLARDVFAAVLTEMTGAGSATPRTLTNPSIGAWGNDGSNIPDSFYPVQIDSLSPAVKPTANILAWPSKAEGYYEFFPLQYAGKISSTYYPGLVKTGTKDWDGDINLAGGVIATGVGHFGSSGSFGGSLIATGQTNFNGGQRTNPFFAPGSTGGIGFPAWGCSLGGALFLNDFLTIAATTDEYGGLGGPLPPEDWGIRLGHMWAFTGRSTIGLQFFLGSDYAFIVPAGGGSSGYDFHLSTCFIAGGGVPFAATKFGSYDTGGGEPQWGVSGTMGDGTEVSGGLVVEIGGGGGGGSDIDYGTW